MAQANTRPSLHGGPGGDEHDEAVRPGDPPGAALGSGRAFEHEDDLPEIALLVDWAWERLSDAARRALAVVRHAVARRTKPDADRVFSHYVKLLEQHPERLELEQSNLFAAMEHAYQKSDMNGLDRGAHAQAQPFGELSLMNSRH